MKRKYYQGVESDYLSSLKRWQMRLNRVTTATDQANEYKEEILKFVDQKDFSTNGLKTLLDSENASVICSWRGFWVCLIHGTPLFEYLESRRSRYQTL